MFKEWLARGIIVLGFAFVISVPFFGHWQQASASELVLHARMPENGGWVPENLEAEVGVPLRLRLTSDDVTHGFAVGMLDQPAVDVNPGEYTDVTLMFSDPGKYTFYCTRWCGVNHWRMRGTIEVSGQVTSQPPVNPPLYVKLGLNIDADHTSSDIPAQIPSAQRGALLNLAIPPIYTSYDYYLSHTPVDLWLAFRDDPIYQNLSNQDVWDLVAWAWQSNIRTDQLQEGRQLYNANCAACHGEAGGGNGVYADKLAGTMSTTGTDLGMGEQTQRPADFTNALRMLSASPAHLQGKILRGGMGTGMPSWGPIFTDDQTWALVSFLWTFQFKLEANP